MGKISGYPANGTRDDAMDFVVAFAGTTYRIRPSVMLAGYALTSSLGTAAALNTDNDATLAANSASLIATQQAVKGYVDNNFLGLKWKRSVIIATTAALTLATDFENGDALDGYTLQTGDRILIKDQASAIDNGIYTVNASGAPTRATDADSGTELVSATVMVERGTVNADTQWTCTSNSITIGASNIAWARVSASATIDAAAVTYTPGTLADWTASADPGNADGAFDQLAYRTKTIEVNYLSAASLGVSPLRYTMDLASQTDADPGSGKIRFNNATVASATVIFIDNNEYSGQAATTLYASLAQTGFLYLTQTDDPERWHVFKITAVVSASGYYKLTVVSQVASSQALQDTKIARAVFTSIGDYQPVDADLTTIAGLAATTDNFMQAKSSAWASRTVAQVVTDLQAGGIRAPLIQTVTSSATVTPTFSDDLVKITAQAAALTLANPTGTAIAGLGMVIRIKDNGTARAITYGSQYRAIGITLPTTTVISKTTYLALIFNSDDTKWDVIATGTEA